MPENDLRNDDSQLSQAEGATESEAVDVQAEQTQPVPATAEAPADGAPSANGAEAIPGNEEQPPSSDGEPTNDEPSPGNKKGAVKKKLIDAALIIIAALLMAYLVRAFVLTPYEIPSGSMLDTIQIDDKVMSEKLSYYFGDPHPGDIVTFEDPVTDDRTLIKRVIATEGQTIEFIDGDVYVDGEKLEEPYLRDGAYTEPLFNHPEGMDFVSYPYTVPEGHVWVMGDNRLESADSRYFGAVDVDTVSGRALFRYWPPSRFGAIE